MADFTIKRHDRRPSIQATLSDTEGPIDLTGATAVRFLMGGDNLIVDAPATIVTAASGIVRYDWDTDDTATAGDFDAEWEITFGDGTTLTCPNDDNLAVRIVADLG